LNCVEISANEPFFEEIMNKESCCGKTGLTTRRGFIRSAALGASGMAIGAGMFPFAARALPQAPAESAVSFVT